MGLYNLGCLGTALYNVRIDGSLCQEINSAQLARLFLKDTDELCADNLTLFLRIRNSFQLGQESLGCVDIGQIGIQLTLEHIDYHF